MTPPTLKTKHMLNCGVRKGGVWTCTGCGIKSLWKAGWTWFGGIDCKACGAGVAACVWCPGCEP